MSSKWSVINFSQSSRPLVTLSSVLHNTPFQHSLEGYRLNFLGFNQAETRTKAKPDGRRNSASNINSKGHSPVKSVFNLPVRKVNKATFSVYVAFSEDDVLQGHERKYWIITPTNGTCWLVKLLTSNLVEKSFNVTLACTSLHGIKIQHLHMF